MDDVNWQEIFDTLTDMVTIHDAEFRIVKANTAARKLLGLPFVNPTPTRCFRAFHGASEPPPGCPSCSCMATRELSDALDRIKTLKGLIPICSWCGSVRNDRGYWASLESYVRDHSDARFSHGICPECATGFDSPDDQNDGKQR